VAGKLAGQRGVDLSDLTGTGPNGRIVRRDLERFLTLAPVPGRVVPGSAVPGSSALGGPVAGPEDPASVRDDDASPTAAADSSAAASADVTLIPHTPMRRAIARRMTESKPTVPHFYLTAEPVVDELLALRERVNAVSPVKVSVNDFVIAAAAAALAEVPEANVTWSEQGLLRYRSVSLSITVATEAGLVTPVLHEVESKKLSVLARETAALAERARERKLLQHELEGGSFAVSNLGMYGTAEFAAIINPPQSAILAVGAARPKPVVADGAVVAATVMRCTLSVDHRAIDGALAARWLAAFTDRIQRPLSALV
jgi:pyruvate dehydrogenase E2 component (dihydrolipoamide acetyltransferase)